MKGKLLLGIFILAFGTTVFAQAAAHKAILVWLDALNPTGTTYSIYRAPGLCSGSPVFAKLATGVAALTYTDTTVTPGNYCYTVTATSGGIESPQSATTLAPVPSFAVTNLSVTVQ